MNHARYIVGVDLGTTNCAVSYVDVEGDGKIKPFAVPQLIAPGEVSKEPLLPSYLYLPDMRRTDGETLALPWRNSSDFAVGVLARDVGSEEPNRFIASAKSWLCHAGVDRRGKILPWNANQNDRARSPVDATQRYLEHVRDAWDHVRGKELDADGNPCRLVDQQVVVTVPASFDETARELTLEAARATGFKAITLLEEPLAVFYSWLARRESSWTRTLKPGERVLVVDVGGGTTDFSIIHLDDDGVLKRTAAGDHLLLGGDNIDAAIAHQAERGWKTELKPGEWTTLCQKTRAAKETIFADGVDKIDVTLLSKGASVVGSARKHTLEAAALKELVLSGFFPLIDSDEPSPRAKSGIQTMGLPYAAEPAVTKHLLAFLRYANLVDGDGRDDVPLRPERILFNGGAMTPDGVRTRVLDVVSSWFPDEKPVKEIAAGDMRVAVARGAAYYGKTRRGQGVKVKSGTERAYFIEVANSDGDRSHVCVMPRGIDENTPVRTPRTFKLEANQKVEFPFFSSHTRLNDQPGDVTDDPEELHALSRLVNVIKFGKDATAKRTVEAEIVTELTPTGNLRVAIESPATGHVWPLSVDVRLIGETAPSISGESVVVDAAAIARAKRAIRETFQATGSKELPVLAKTLEEIVDLSREEWTIPLLRELGDALLDVPKDDLRTAEKEFRWLNLCGFCLRPGFGEPADNLRVKNVWKRWYDGLNNPNNPQTQAEWWVFWRRIAPGLGSGRQKNIFQTLFKQLTFKGEYSTKVGAPQVKAEMWRCLGSLEELSANDKKAAGRILLDRGAKIADEEFWVLARLGARRLFHAPVNQILPAATVVKWLDRLMATKIKQPNPMRSFALARIAAVSGDRGLDVPVDKREAVKKFLAKSQAKRAWIEHVDKFVEDSKEEQVKVLGDSVPLGLVLIS